MDDKLTTVNYLSEHHHHYYYKERNFSALRAQGWVDVVCYDQGYAVHAAACAVHIVVFKRSIVGVAPEDVKDQSALEDDQSPGNDEPELRLNKEHLPAVFAPQPHYSDQQRAAGKASDTDGLKIIAGNAVPFIPGHVVTDPTEEV